jgi:hypothetical protein
MLCRTVPVVGEVFLNKPLNSKYQTQREEIRVGSNGKIIRAGKNIIIRRRVVPLSVFFIKNSTLTGQG